MSFANFIDFFKTCWIFYEFLNYLIFDFLNFCWIWFFFNFCCFNMLLIFFFINLLLMSFLFMNLTFMNLLFINLLFMNLLLINLLLMNVFYKFPAKEFVCQSTDLDLPIYIYTHIWNKQKNQGLAEVQIWISLNVYWGIRKKNDGLELKYRFGFAYICKGSKQKNHVVGWSTDLDFIEE